MTGFVKVVYHQENGIRCRSQLQGRAKSIGQARRAGQVTDAPGDERQRLRRLSQQAIAITLKYPVEIYLHRLTTLVAGRFSCCLANDSIGKSSDTASEIQNYFCRQFHAAFVFIPRGRSGDADLR
jgi:hypothetical protein